MTRKMDNMNEFLEEATEGFEESLPSASEFANGLNIPITHIIIALVAILIIGAVFFLINKKHKYNKKDTLKEEISLYKNQIGNYFEPENRIAGNISIINNKIKFSRGNRSVLFDIPIERITYISPDKIAPWFEGRNYNYKEEQIIISNIKTYLLNNKICAKVIIKENEDIFDSDFKNNE